MNPKIASRQDVSRPQTILKDTAQLQFSVVALCDYEVNDAIIRVSAEGSHAKPVASSSKQSIGHRPTFLLVSRRLLAHSTAPIAHERPIPLSVLSWVRGVIVFPEYNAQEDKETGTEHRKSKQRERNYGRRLRSKRIDIKNKPGSRKESQN
jgi:hypothetical protein